MSQLNSNWSDPQVTALSIQGLTTEYRPPVLRVAIINAFEVLALQERNLISEDEARAFLGLAPKVQKEQ